MILVRDQEFMVSDELNLDGIHYILNGNVEILALSQ